MCVERSQTVAAQVLYAGYAVHEEPYRSPLHNPLGCYLFRLQTEGVAHTRMNREWTLMRAGDLLVMSPKEAYQIEIPASSIAAEGPSSDFYIYARGVWIDEWWEEKARPSYVHVGQDLQLMDLCKLLVEECGQHRWLATDISTYLLQALCLTADRAILLATTTERGTDKLVVQQMKEFVEQRARQRFTVSDVAQHVGLSPSRASHLFKQAYGVSIMQHTLDVRLRLACEGIRLTKLSLEEIADRSGFSTYSYFHRAFRSRFGVSPKQFRSLS
ncbi:MAG: helix-turn-helix transcriptional regulator [Alicyclobacillaceae bacterium]|nr:helix-turn-helix transcriptional regulator [Alicyclobacillaceae bacterium]